MVDLSDIAMPTQALAGKLRKEILRGHRAVGSVLPSTRRLASKYGISTGTVMGAFRTLEAEDLIECRPRRRSFVKAGGTASRKMLIGKKQIAVIHAVGSTATPPGASSGLAIFHAAENALVQKGFHPAMCLYPSGKPDYIKSILSRIDDLMDDLAGVIVRSQSADQCLLDELDRRKLPWVMMGQAHHDDVNNFVASHDVSNCRTVGRCLSKLGVERILFLGVGTQKKKIASEVNKFTGIAQGYMFEGKGLTVSGLLTCEAYPDHDAYEKVSAYLHKNPPPHAIFACGDFQAIGAMKACRDKGLSVPEDVGIIGSTGLEVARHTQPSLTVVAQPFQQLGDELVAMLLEKIEKGVFQMPGRKISGQFIIRDSLNVPQSIRDELELRL